MGANDGIVSTASLMIGVAAAAASQNEILIAGTAGLVAGAMSMAAGEYVSVCSQADTEKADIELEKHHLENHADYELQELTDIYLERGLSPQLAKEVAAQLMSHDALGAHLRDELGIHERTTAQPIMAALTSAISFTCGAALPLLVAFLSTNKQVINAIALTSLLFLGLLGILAAKAGGASKRVGAVRVVFWGALAMAMTALVGRFFGYVLA
jgi:VIT1/CCC1 family predicted Fe2+/Mn2+ transporter